MSQTMQPNSNDEILRIFPSKRQIPEKKPKSFVLYPFELHAKMKEPLDVKVEESKRLILNHLKMFKRCYVATSHGKDSLIVCHLVETVAKELGMQDKLEYWLNDTMNTYKEEKAFWQIFNKWLGIENRFRVFVPPKLPNGEQATVWSIAKMVGHLPDFRRTARHKSMSYKHSNTPECCDILKKASIKDYLKTLPVDERFDCHFVGTRAEESQMRSLGVLQRCRSYLITTRKAYPIRAVTPLSFWTKTDVYEYFIQNQMPMNPTYEIHNLERMGCASCPAHKNWEIRLAQDPTEEGFGMLKQNLKILSETEPERLKASLDVLRAYTSSQTSEKQLTEAGKLRLIKIIQKFDKTFITLSDYTTAGQHG